MAALILAGCAVPGGQRGFENPEAGGYRLFWTSSPGSADYPPSIALSELDDHPDLPNYALSLTCLGGGRLAVIAESLSVATDVGAFAAPETLTLSAGARRWSGAVVPLTNIGGYSLAPASELAVADAELPLLLSQALSVGDQHQSVTYPAPPAAMSQGFSQACMALKARFALESVLPSVTVVEPPAR